jgi:hypothetical protein
MNPFVGTWTDLAGVKISVTEVGGNLVSIAYSDHRGPFSGFEFTVAAPTLTAYFPDDSKQSFTGVLTKSGKIQWSNDTTWTKA